nr:stabilin-2 [Manis javanica]
MLQNVLLLFLGLVVQNVCSLTEATEQTKRCDKKSLLTIRTECRSCSLSVGMNCPDGYTKITNGTVGVRDCRYTFEVRTLSLALPGCRHICRKDYLQPQCCPGHWGPDCMECPGGARSPCSGRGSCAEGMEGNGSCSCQEGFGGTACETCADDNLFGPSCSAVCNCVHGVCNSGIDGDGTCDCYSAYTGPNCDKPIPECAHLLCGENSRCSPSSRNKTKLECKCLPNYKGDGKYCEPINPCLQNICHLHARCTYLGPNRHSCTCQEGFHGDGHVCLPVDPCQNNYGNCPPVSTVCKYDGPGQSHCECKEHYHNFVPGVGCSVTNICESHNPCHKNANCTTIAPGQTKCTCQKGYVGNGLTCYGNIMERLQELNIEPRGKWQGRLTSFISLLDKAYAWPLSNLGPFTVLLPTDRGLKGLNVKELLMDSEAARYFVKLHIIAGQMDTEHMNNTDTFYTLTGKSGEIFSGDKDNQIRLKLLGGKKKVKIIQGNIIASNGLLHILDRAMDRMVPTFKSNTEQTIMMMLQPRYSKFRSLLEETNVGRTLDEDGVGGPYTIFVPSNEALNNMKDGALDYLLSPEGSRKLLELIRYHIVPFTQLEVATLISTSHIRSLANQIIQFNTTNNGQILANDVAMEETEVTAKNGRIYTLTGVLIPPSIVPILPHRCDDTEREMKLGSCVSCSLIHWSKCPANSVPTTLFTHRCVYSSRIRSLKSGCARFCNATVKVRARLGTHPGHASPHTSQQGWAIPGTVRSEVICGALAVSSCKGIEGQILYMVASPPFPASVPPMVPYCSYHRALDAPHTARPLQCLTSHPHSHLSTHTCHSLAQCAPPDSLGADSSSKYSSNWPFLCHHRPTAASPVSPNLGPYLPPSRICLHSSQPVVWAGAVCPFAWRRPPSQGIWFSNYSMCHIAEPHLGVPEAAGLECLCVYGTCDNRIDSDGACLAGTCRHGSTGRFCHRQTSACGPYVQFCHIHATCEYSNGTASCVCKAGYEGDGNLCSEMDPCAELTPGGCSHNAECIRTGPGTHTCVCQQGWTGDGRDCSVINNCLLPSAGGCHESAACLYIGPGQNECECRKGFRGNGIDCEPTSCLEQTGLCHPLATCQFTSGVWSCVCPEDYEGDGALCYGNAAVELSFLSAAAVFNQWINNASLQPLLSATSNLTVLVPSQQAIEDMDQDEKDFWLTKSNIPALIKYHTLLGTYGVADLQALPSSDMLATSLHGNFLHLAKVDGNITIEGASVIDGDNAATNGVIHIINKLQKSSAICSEKERRGALFCKELVILLHYQEALRSTFLKCCAGFFGPQCQPCPGNTQNVCFGNGVCLDGVNGTGMCECGEGFGGTACETCIEGKYGIHCDQACSCVHGRCSQGPTGDGSCDCDVGWRGVKCDSEITKDNCNGTCHTSANCLLNPDGTATCRCAAGFQGNGTSCTAINACEISNGGCSTKAYCKRTTPGSRVCMCKAGYTGDGIVCLEINPCLENNGGCHRNAECTQTGPNQAVCNCLPKYTGDGRVCTPINLCLSKNGGCSEFAICSHTAQEDRTCTCKPNYIGDGFTCHGNIQQELPRNPKTSQYFFQLMEHSVQDLVGPGPFTVLAPLSSAFDEEPRIKDWDKQGLMPQVLRYHVIACHQLLLENLKLIPNATSLQGESIVISVSQDKVFINNKANIISSDIISTNGIIHIIDKLLSPKNMHVTPKDASGRILQNLTTVAVNHGYVRFSNLIQDAGLLSLITDPVHTPVTLFWPSDQALQALPREQQDFLFNQDNKDKLKEYLKFHVIRDSRVSSVDLPRAAVWKTLQGSELSVKCGAGSDIGDLFLNDQSCRIVQRELLFDLGVAYGIDCLLIDPTLGGRCDTFATYSFSGDCWSCVNTPSCPRWSKPKGMKQKCQYGSAFRGSLEGCQEQCTVVIQLPKCCKGYFGRDCQACPGGAETPCNNRGVCLDQYSATGECKCNTGFNGTACELCWPGRFGPDCQPCGCSDHGQCDDGITGSGQCLCETGWTGHFCDSQTALPPVCTPPCSADATCKDNNTCECNLNYEGDGITCTVVDFCKQNNGGCAKVAKCSQKGTKVSCSCPKGYLGDGHSCIEMNPCADGFNGGCHEHATCKMTGPGKHKCDCKSHYVGDGRNCEPEQLPIDRCLQDNGQCHADADCADLHFQDTTAGVFHLRSPLGQYKLTFDKAREACASEAATIATYNQLSYAQKARYHLCSAGWLEGGRVAYPTAYASQNCGSGVVGIIDYGTRNNKSEMWDVFCYRMKDVNCTCKVGYVGDGLSCSGNLLQVLMSFPSLRNFLMEVLAYSNSSARGQAFLKHLTDLSIRSTLFAPQNSGLGENETLPGRDIEHHLANVSIFFYNDLVNGTILQTRLGGQLLITSSQDQSQLETRFVDGRAILQWDIFASNGIIHVISGPLKAPPTPRAAAHTGLGTGLFFAITLVVGVTALGAYSYFRLNRRIIGFQRFESEEDIHVAALGKPQPENISNPMYESATSAPSDPSYNSVSDSEDQLEISDPLGAL